MLNLIQSLLSNPRLSFLFFGGVSAASLGMAFMAQYGFDLQPCILCVYQRWPFGIAIGLASFGVWLSNRYKHSIPALMGAISLTFFVNALTAFYHTGVERHWWKSFLEGCAVPNMEGNITDVLARIAQTPIVRCDEIPWTDPVLGLSMANYNMVMCLGLGFLALISTILIMRRA